MSKLHERLARLERERRRDEADLLFDSLRFIPTDDIEWLLSQPMNAEATEWDYTRWAPEEIARFTAIATAAMVAGRAARAA